MKKLILAIPIIVILAIVAIPATLYGIAEIEKARVEQIEAKTAQMRVQIDADNAQHARAKDWFYTIGSAVLLSFFIVRYELISRRQNEKINVVINWVGRRKGK